MFLHELKDNLKKMLFIELATLILMAEGDDKVTPSFSETFQNEGLDDINLNDISSKNFSSFMAGHTLTHNIDEGEVEIFEQYAKELKLRFHQFEDGHYDEEINVGVLLDSSYSSYQNFLNDDGQIIIGKEEPGDEGLTSLSYALGQASKFVMEESQGSNEIKELVISIVSNNLNANPIKIKEEILKLPSIQQKILERAADILIKTKSDFDHMSPYTEREKKIMLFELIGSGFASGHFEDQEKSLLTKICVLMDIEKEYIDEFTDVTTRLFVVNKELAELINE